MTSREVDLPGDVPSELVRLVPEKNRQFGEFVCLNWDVWQLLLASIPTLDRLPAVLSCIVNGCRVCKNRTIIFRPKWYRHLGIPGKTVRRSLDRLELAGFLTQTKSRGRSPEITLADHVPLELARHNTRKQQQQTR